MCIIVDENRINEEIRKKSKIKSTQNVCIKITIASVRDGRMPIAFYAPLFLVNVKIA